ncbi:hypothetical protein GCM10010285_11500 [Streptomyces pseudogriseolus]|uniref:Uncharacterized protein n=1 Tax=Streptomyces pseudogriseolus TaxID=36817 RepID=A0ABQ2SMM6_STREZ|nr:hypothetical protein GCM10010285_11500 [Streptomyces rubiginosus]
MGLGVGDGEEGAAADDPPSSFPEAHSPRPTPEATTTAPAATATAVTLRRRAAACLPGRRPR